MERNPSDATRRLAPAGLWKVVLIVLPCVASLGGFPSAAPESDDALLPNVLVISVDTLRADRMSAFGHERPTSPHMDRLLLQGVNFAQARTVEPLTNPSMASIFTSLSPNRHGATRNGLRVRRGLPSLTKVLSENGYRTAGFVGSWTLRDKLSGLAEHFDAYEEVLTRARWFGLVRNEATARDLNDRAVEWIEEHAGRQTWEPFAVWVHYVEPHAPYRLQKDFLSILDTEQRKSLPAKDRYDTEIAFVDAAIGDLLERVGRLSPPGETLIVLVSDHGESLGEHRYWGHGRNLYEPSLRVPMGLFWDGHLPARTIDAPAVTLDLAPTVLGLLNLPKPSEFEGYDWTAVLDGAPVPEGRVTRYEAHKGAVISKHESDLARQSGLLELALIRNGKKEIFSLKKDRYYVFDLARDPGELRALAPAPSDPSADLVAWMDWVRDGLESFEDEPVELLDEESIAALRSLGYVD